MSASSARSRLAHQDLEHRADGVELGRAVTPRRVEEPARREPGTQHQPGADRERPEHGVRRRVDVEQRQRGHHPVRRRQLHPPREALTRPGVGALGLHHQLGASRRPRRRDQHHDVARVDPVGHRHLDGVPLGAPVAEEVAEVEHPRLRRGGRGVHDLSQLSIGHHRAWLHLGQQPGELVGCSRGVGGHRHRSHAGQGEPDQDVRRRGPCGDHDQVAGTYAGLGEALGEPAHVGGRTTEAERAFVGPEPGAVRVTGDGGGQQSRDGVVRDHNVSLPHPATRRRGSSTRSSSPRGGRPLRWRPTARWWR